MRKPGFAEFPDSVTDRGTKHLRELAHMRAAGARAIMLYVVQIPSADGFAIARDIDPAYGAAFEEARQAGVEMLAWRCNVRLAGIEIVAPVPVVDP
jgi:sugar fermentation stimulation protein A